MSKKIKAHLYKIPQTEGDPTTIVKNKIMEYLQINEQEYQDFIDSLKKYNAVIAGGFVLSCFSGFISNDIDIYITCKNMKKFASNLPPFLSPILIDFISKYDSIGKKYVQRMLCYKYDKNNERVYHIKVDIVIVDDNYTVDEVIDNFDLTFCKIWFDGDNVYASHPNDVKKKVGHLNKKYLNDYYLAIKTDKTRSNLIHGRNIKYTKRGFKITIGEDPHPDTNFVPKEEDGIPILLSSKQTSENYIVKLMLQNFTNVKIVKNLINDMYCYSKYISKYIPESKYTREYTQRHYIEKITLLKFYFISLFKEFTFKEYIKNIQKFFKNIKIQHVYKCALYTLEGYLSSVYNIRTVHDFNDTRNMHFIDRTREGQDSRQQEFDPNAYSIMRFIIDKHLNKYENYKFTYIIDFKFPLILKKTNIETINSELFNKLLLNKSNICIKIIKKNDVIAHLQDSKLTGFEIITCEEDVNIADYLSQDKENIIICVILPNNTTITCISKKDLDTMISFMNDNWFYDCSKMPKPHEIPLLRTNLEFYKINEYLYRPFIKVPLSNGTFYFEYTYIYNLLMSKQQVFFVYRPTGDKEEKILETVSFKNTNYGISNGIGNYVGASHCQDGSDITLSIIKTLKLDDKKKVDIVLRSFSKSASSNTYKSSSSSSKTSRTR
jgi:hypothetical protein